MNEDSDGPSLWRVLVIFLVFCCVIGLLFGLMAYGLMHDVVGAIALELPS